MKHPTSLERADDRLRGFVWVTSDWHLGHRNIIRYAGRPFPDAKTMDEEILRRHNEVVGPADGVLHLGDVFVGVEDEDWLRLLLSEFHGRFTLVAGNHDSRTKLAILREHGWQVIEPFLAAWRGRWVYFSHEPPDLTQADLPGGALSIHGHDHAWDSSWVSVDHTNVNLERFDYRPIRLADLLDRVTAARSEGA